MEIFRFTIEKEAVGKGQQEGDKFLRVSNACPCGCAPQPFISISDGETGLTVRFESEEELQEFKAQVHVLAMPWTDNCRYCKHLKAVNKPREKYIGACELRLNPKDCGKFTFRREFFDVNTRVGIDPRHLDTNARDWKGLDENA